MSDTVSIYGLYDPVEFEVRYVGAADDIQRRFGQHCTDARQQRSAIGRWIWSLHEQGLRPIPFLLSEALYENCATEETWWIDRLRKDGHDLLNVHKGGVGGLSRSLHRLTPTDTNTRRKSARGTGEE